MSNQLLGLGITSLVVAIDSALLAGMVLPWTSRQHKQEIMIVVGIALGITQIILTIWVDQFLSNGIFRVLVILVLIWISIRTLIPQASRSYTKISVMWKVFVYTTLGNFDNIIWLGSELEGQYLWLICFSLITIPIFIVTSLFLSDRCERHHWIRILGSGMMAWAAAGLIVEETPVGKLIGDNVSFSFSLSHLAITLFILVMGLIINLLIIRRRSH
ncbi:hypothetical protein [Alicyclobacillus kakegawensis]|uniref:hypothetical protein n=1 Tax=Alicyclobacillus kakegawensis TaxID=392012 RepID=UPI00082A0ADC|nr:hypothetical protein [Alicyclobacillus kakegawensis]